MKFLILTLLIPSILLAETHGYVYPLMDTRISSGFGTRKHPIKKIIRHHKGIDLAVPRDTPIRAIADGLVVYADPHSGYGNFVVLKHKDGTTSHYGHCEKILAKTGSHVKAGKIIALVGDSGLATGPHLHLEIRKDGIAKDPLKVFPALSKKAKG